MSAGIHTARTVRAAPPAVAALAGRDTCNGTCETTAGCCCVAGRWVQDSGFTRVIHGNAISGPHHRRPGGRVGRILRALRRWLNQPSPWSRTP